MTQNILKGIACFECSDSDGVLTPIMIDTINDQVCGIIFVCDKEECLRKVYLRINETDAVKKPGVFNCLTDRTPQRGK